jgi:hypothetical protein
MTRFICDENRQEEESASPVPGIGLDVLSRAYRLTTSCGS